MRAKKCDRCGELYPVGGDEKLRLMRQSISTGKHSKGIDLCDRCQLSLIEWLEAGKKHE